MFPLAGNEFPTTPADLATALRGALAEHMTFPSGARGVEATGPALDRMQQVVVDLSNASVAIKPPPPKPVITGARTPGVNADQLRVVAKPLRIQNGSAQFELNATGVKCDFARDQNGKPLLVLAGAEEGTVNASVGKSDLQAILLAGAKVGAAQQGVTIQDLQIDLTPQGPRGVGINLRVKAKKMMMSGVVSIRGSARIDDQLNAKISGLSCDGDGVVGKMAAAMLSPKLRDFEGKQIALSALSLGDLVLRDLQIDVSNGLRVTAEIGEEVMATLTLQQALELAILHHDAGRLREAESLYRQILQIDARNAEALRMLGLLAHQVGRHADAEQLIRQAAALQPQADYFSNLGVVLAVQKKFDEAIAAFGQALTLSPNDPQTLTNLGSALVETRRFGEAIAIYRRVIAQQPSLVEAHYNLGKALQESGDAAGAVDAYRRATVLQPNHADAWNNLGSALKQLNRPSEAIAAYRRAIESRSDFAEAQNNLGSALNQSGDAAAAIDAYQKAIALRGEFPEAQNNLGNTLERVGRTDEAADAYRAALALKSDFPEAYNNLANVLLETNRPDEAIACYRKAIALRTDYADALNNLGNVLKETGRIDAAIEACTQAAAQSDDSRVAGNLMYLRHFHPASKPRDLFDMQWNERFASHIQRMEHGNDRDPNRRLKIGYVSPDLREHPVGRFMLPLMRRHDHSQFEIHCYTDNANTDPLALELRSHADAWNVTTGLSDAQLAERIHADGIDVLVDLTMHLKGSRLLAFAHKPAPLQITYLAYCSTTALRAMDYRFTDAKLDPDEAGGFYAEKSVYLRSYWCYPAPANSPDAGPLPMDSAGHVTFGCLNNFSKTNVPLLETWAKILLAIPNSRMVIHSHEGSHRQEVLALFERLGVDAARITFNGFQPLDRYLAQYQQIDIALDPFPYAGGTTTCDALWMGVPVVSRTGPTAVSRGGASLLSNLNLADLIGSSEESYVQIASELANDRTRLDELRKSIRQRMMVSPLMDDVGFARDVEGHYRELWERWVTKRD